MTTLDATVSAAQTGIVAPAGAPVRFRDRSRAFWRLLVHGAVWLMLTLGIYRFWLTTDIRRHLWSSTELAGESFEYIGTARELLLGFLIAITILLPLNAALFIVTLSLGEFGEVATVVLSFVLLGVLGQYAVYRARRYRLSRTVYRGLRFHQTGSAWRYAVCAVFWWTLIVLTAGLAYPFAQSRLERFKMRHTFYGNLPGRFEGSGASLFLGFFLLWLIAVLPFAAAIVLGILGIDWSALTSAAGGDDLMLSWLEASGLDEAVIYAGLTGTWLLLSLAVLYPIFQAMMLRWWAGGVRFGDIALKSHLRTAQVYGVYARFLWYAFLFTLVAGVAVGVGWFGLENLTGELDTMRDEIITTVAGIGAYVAIALGYATIHQATVRLGLWRCLAESLDLSNLAVLEHVSAAGDAASPVGEGLADALGGGGV
jgi:uncharacterized membrane protein YjgN (DUF898 family)